jgi:tetratricopeptide (TPR) repeat protein
MQNPRIQKAVGSYVEIFKSYEKLLGYGRKLCMADDKMAIGLSTVYAIWGAFQVRKCICVACKTNPVHEESKSNFKDILPTSETVNQGARDLFLALSAGDNRAIVSALREMGVTSLCPQLALVFPRMEEITSWVGGRAQLLFLVDLALFSVKCGDYKRATEYVRQARASNPRSRELYNICVIEGLIALNDGRREEAVQCLAHSTEVCQADVDASIQCSLLPPNLELAQNLLELGERIAVLQHLFGCHNVWQRSRAQIEEWIHLIEKGGAPACLAIDDADKLSDRLSIQWMRACSLEMQLYPARSSTPMSPTQVLAGRERRTAEHRTHMNAHLKRKLEYLEKDLPVSPDQPSSNPSEPDQPE